METLNVQLLKTNDSKLNAIADKVAQQERLSVEETIYLYEKAELGWLGKLSSYVRFQKNGDKAYYNRNFHLEPTNICLYQCKFCSYKRKVGEEGSWEFSFDEIADKVLAYKNSKVTEIHIVGGVHPQRDMHYYCQMMQKIKSIIPHLHIKAFTAIELEFMIKKAGLLLAEGLKQLKESGLDSIPGGGAEIFEPEIRKILCPEKPDGQRWLEVHEAAHKAGLPSNATMLYGHIENYSHRVEHMAKIRDLQDRTKGFNAFIPLKYRKENNHLSYIGEVSVVEDLKNYAVARLFFDNISHLKAYWPMIGRETTQIALSFGVDDIDGTIDDSTKIYSMAGVTESNTMSATEMTDLIKGAGRIPIERDSLYKEVDA